MKFPYYIFFAALVLFLPISLVAQEKTPDDEIVEEFDDIDSDTTHMGFIDSTQLMVQGFDTTSVPAADIYKSWSHIIVNPYDTNQVKKADTTVIDLSGYCHPRKNYITSDFGFRRYRHHYGVDLKVHTGDTIYSSFGGMVRICKYSRSYGNYVVVRHYNGLETIYAHLSKPLVSLNQVVKAGEPLGLGGNTGRSTGPHLHYEVRYLGQCINPHDIIDFENYSLRKDTLYLCAQNFAYLIEIQKIRYHVVRRGDTLGRIALKYGTTVSRLCKLNKIRSTKILRIGQRIRYT